MTDGRDDASLGFSTRAIHHGYDPAAFSGALAPPVFLTSTFSFPNVAAIDAAAAQSSGLYARDYNPTTTILEQRLASLEGAEACVVLASGMAAFGALTLSLLSWGDEIIVHKDLYLYTRKMLEDALPRFGIRVIPVDLSLPDNLDAALSDRTRLVYFETPGNPGCGLLDIAEISCRAHRRGVKVVVDGTFASPALQRPIEHGADIVLHSLTKYINGHGDLLGGALLADAATISRLKGEGLKYITGATLSPFAAAMVLRGLKTLDLRMERHSFNALAVAEYLDAHPKVGWVNYPFLKGYPERALACAQMSAGSGMVAFGLHEGFEGARRMVDGLQLFARALSLGDAESLVTHPASLRRARPHGAAADDIQVFGDDDLVRLSVGLENVSDLIDDLDRALEAC